MTPATNPPPEPRRWRVDQADAGERLDRWLADRLNRSRAEAISLLAAGMVRLDGRAMDRRDKGVTLRAGHDVELLADELRPAPSDAPLAVAAEGADWLIADKPAGLAVHPLSPDQRDTLLNRVAARRPEIVGVGEGGLRSGVVHRLDLATSGLVLLALSNQRYREARTAFAEHETDKRYFAVVRGEVKKGRRVELDLTVARHSPARVAVVQRNEEPGGNAVRRCGLSFEPVEHAPGRTLLNIRLETGFLHQIRITLTHLGHPVLGDDTYGPTPDRRDAPRLMLHAHTLRVGEAAARTELPDALRSALRGEAAEA